MNTFYNMGDIFIALFTHPFIAAVTIVLMLGIAFVAGESR